MDCEVLTTSSYRAEVAVQEPAELYRAKTIAYNSVGLYAVTSDWRGREYRFQTLEKHYDVPSLVRQRTNMGLSPVVEIVSLKRIGLAKLALYGPPLPSKHWLQRPLSARMHPR